MNIIEKVLQKAIENDWKEYSGGYKRDIKFTKAELNRIDPEEIILHFDTSNFTIRNYIKILTSPEFVDSFCRYLLKKKDMNILSVLGLTDTNASEHIIKQKFLHKLIESLYQKNLNDYFEKLIK